MRASDSCSESSSSEETEEFEEWPGEDIIMLPRNNGELAFAVVGLLIEGELLVALSLAAEEEVVVVVKK